MTTIADGLHSKGTALVETRQVTIDMLPEYKSHKTVRAATILWLGAETPAGTIKVTLEIPSGRQTERAEIEVPSSVFARGRPQVRDLIVFYPPSATQPEGYISWSPRGVFEEGYERV